MRETDADDPGVTLSDDLVTLRLWSRDDAEFIATQIAETAETGFLGGEPTEGEAIRVPFATGVAKEA